MAQVFITDEQQKVLDEHEFQRLVLERDNLTRKIFAHRVLTFGPMVLEEDAVLLKKLNEKIHLGETLQKNIDEKLAVLRKKLGIETPTIHTEL